MILVRKDGMLEPFNILLSRESQIALMAVANGSTEDSSYADGEIDFGTALDDGEYSIKGIIEHIKPSDRYGIYEHLNSLFLRCLDTQVLKFEKNPSMITYGWIIGKPEIIPYPTWMDISFTLKLDPFWYGSLEKTLIGSGNLVNDGTFETGLIIEIPGPATNLSVTIGGQKLSYNGTIASGQKLIIDTENRTAKIGVSNARANYNKVFPLLYPGETTVSAPSNVTIKWCDKWI